MLTSIFVLGLDDLPPQEASTRLVIMTHTIRNFFIFSPHLTDTPVL
jgi:hypothetical protein